MKKKNLTNTMFIEFRNKEQQRNSSSLFDENWNNDLTHKSRYSLDVIAVYDFRGKKIWEI